jgi:hypothetical protein
VATNAIVLIIVVAMAVLVLSGLVTLVVRKTRTQSPYGIGETIGHQVRKNTLRIRRREVLAVESDATPHEAGLLTQVSRRLR